MVRVLKENLVKALGAVKPAIPSKATLPVLTHVGLRTEKDLLVVMGTDLETFVEASIHCKADESEVEICVPSATFSQYVAALSDEVLFLESTEHKLTVTQGENTAEFPGIPYTEFPLIPPVPEDNKIELDSATLGYAFHSVLHSAGTDVGRAVLTGVFIKHDGNELTTVCADGFRMAVTSLSVDAEPFQMIVPAKSIQTSLRKLPEGTAFLMWDDVRVAFDLPFDGNIKTKVYCQTIQGNYVNYAQIIPEKANSFTVARDGLIDSLKRCNVFAGQEANVVHFTPSGYRLTLEGRASDAGEGVEKVGIDYSGEEITFALNGTYAIDALSTCDDVVTVEVTAPNRPIVVSSERGTHLCVLMPMAIRNK